MIKHRSSLRRRARRRLRRVRLVTHLRHRRRRFKDVVRVCGSCEGEVRVASFLYRRAAQRFIEQKAARARRNGTIFTYVIKDGYDL